MTSHFRSMLTAALALSVFSACTREQRTLTVEGALVVTRQSGGETQIFELLQRLYDTQLSPTDFERAWDAAFGGDAIGTGLALSASGGGQPAAGVVPLLGLELVLPTPLSRGEVIPVSGTFPAPQTMPLYWTEFGPHDLAVQGSAAIALRLFDYRSVGLVVEREFIATSASGTIEVVSIGDEHLELQLDITARNAAGEIVRITGPVSVRGERYRPPYT
jgi:hypothetical protein